MLALPQMGFCYGLCASILAVAPTYISITPEHEVLSCPLGSLNSVLEQWSAIWLPGLPNTVYSPVSLTQTAGHFHLTLISMDANDLLMLSDNVVLCTSLYAQCLGQKRDTCTINVEKQINKRMILVLIDITSWMALQNQVTPKRYTVSLVPGSPDPCLPLVDIHLDMLLFQVCLPRAYGQVLNQFVYLSEVPFSHEKTAMPLTRFQVVADERRVQT